MKDQGGTLGQGLGEVGIVLFEVLRTCLRVRLPEVGWGLEIWGELGSFLFL